MPQARPSISRDRETNEIHAEWWSPLRTVDGTVHSPVVADGEPGHFVERVVIYAEQFGADTHAIQAKLLRNVNLQNVGEAKSANELARQRFYLFQRMVVEVTNDQGVVQPLNEQFMSNTPEVDLDFIEREIKKTAQPPVPVTERDEAEAAQEAADHERMLARGTPEHYLKTPRSADVIAMDDFR